MHSLIPAWPEPRRSRPRRKPGTVAASIAPISCSTGAIAQTPAAFVFMDNGNFMGKIVIRL